MMYRRPGPSFRPDDEGFEQFVENVLEELEDSGDDSDYIEESDHDTESEQEQDDENEYENDSNTTNNEGIYYGKNKCFKWCADPPPVNVRTRKHNLLVKLPVLRGPAKHLGESAEPHEVWNLLFTDNVIAEIIEMTNLKLEKVRSVLKDRRADLYDIDESEMRALLGLLMYTSIFKSSHESVLSLFATDGTGRDIFRATMSMKRFLSLLGCLRFDNTETRQERLKENRAAAISKLFSTFVENSRLFNPGAYMTVDEMLIQFRGRCKFRMYMPKKPARYGLKVMTMTDYFYNGYIYTGKESDGEGLNQDEKKLAVPTQAVIRLTKPIERTNRNITADNWFSSIELVQELQKRGLTYVGTMKVNKREIPIPFLPNKSRPVGSDLYGFHSDITLLSYVPKKSKAVLLISSMHHQKETDPSNNKPKIISLYNLTKGGVDSLDKKCAIYSSNRRTNRWPMAVFYILLDISTNAFILYGCYKTNPTKNRFDFVKKLADSMVIPFIKARLNSCKSISLDLRSCMERILAAKEGKTIHSVDVCSNVERLEVKKTFYLCPPKLKRKTFFVCFTCQKPICLQCARKVCGQCANSLK